MKRTIKTPHDVVQVLIDIIVANGYKIVIFTQYFSLLNQVKVTINTFAYLYICFYEVTGDKVEIRKFRKKFTYDSKVIEACSFRGHGVLSGFSNMDSFPVKIKIINL